MKLAIKGYKNAISAAVTASGVELGSCVVGTAATGISGVRMAAGEIFTLTPSFALTIWSPILRSSDAVY